MSTRLDALEQTIRARCAPLRHPAWRIVGALVGLGLLLAAIIVAWNQRGQVGEAVDAIGTQTAGGLIAALMGCVVLNIVLAGVLMYRLNRRFGEVGVLEMQAVIAAATLMNFLPLRPGLFARVAYHARYNDMRVHEAGLAVIQAMVLSLIVAALLCVAAAGHRWLGIDVWWTTAAAAAVLVAATLLGQFRFWAICLLIRLTELLVWALRVWIAFRLTGITIGFDAAAVFSAVISIASMIPLISNGLGVREWAVALLAPALASTALETGLLAELVGRAAELVVTIAVGLPAIVWLVAHRRRSATTSVQG